MRGDFFKGVKQWEFDWQGQTGKLPVFYYDNTTMTAIYTAATDKVKRLLPNPKMKAIELYPGRCLVGFTAFEYRKTDIDPYNELSISFLATLDKPQIPGVTTTWQMVRRNFSAFIWQLPVTTEIARVGGVEMYGYPKFIADIEFRREGDRIQCQLAEQGKTILSLRGRMLPTTAGKLTHYTTYSVLDGITLAANVFVNPLEFAQTTDKKAATLEIGSDHPISEKLRELDLSPAPLLYQFSPVNEAILFAGRNLMDR